MKVKVDLKLCGVCGDKALGYNFNAITCESCKAFFRRNALLQKEFKCPFDNHCDITQVTRRFCQKCRLDKCFSIGMCKDLIMSEHAKTLKRQKIEENRANKRKIGGFKSGFKKIKKERKSTEDNFQVTDSYSVYTDSDSKETVMSDQGYQPNNPNIGVINYVNSENSNITTQNECLVTSSDDVRRVISPPSYVNQEKEVENVILESLVGNVHRKCNNIGNNAQSPVEASQKMLDITKDVVQDVQRINAVASSPIESILCEAIKLEYEAYSSIAPCQSNSRELNDAERAKLNELIVANKSLLSPVDAELNTLLNGESCKFKGDPQNPALVDVINLTAIAIRRLIIMAKKINAFKNMCQEDQVALLKGGCTEIMILRSAINYDAKRQTWKIPHSQDVNVNVDILKLAKGNMYQEHDKFIKTFNPLWRSDENIILILCAIVLFTPDRQRLIHQDVIKLEQNSYYYLLRRYLESIHPGCEAKSTFLKLIQKITELHKLNEEVINVYLNVNPSEVEPILLEIFDLNI
ncbi:unnamed protein product [Brassicogethes aeneus]|uniref:Nuclear receptor domain-containing protein n=1 Tax=Brassicogethes aeneus TaxID=1431903 RepID=A0A9P0B315_BRAAE|nr:unnamed protein product [Brassicogethes aeneus]